MTDKDTSAGRFSDGQYTVLGSIADIELKEELHGGPGSGNWGHAGRPGEVGGSGPGAGDTKGEDVKIGAGFVKSEWASMTMDERRAAWSKVSVRQRDTLADAKNSIRQREAQLLKDAREWDDERPVNAAMRDRISSVENDIGKDAATRVGRVMEDYTENMRLSGMDEETMRPLAKAATDTLLAQEMEAQTRQLGDHGIHHIKGNLDRTNRILAVIPSEEVDPVEAVEIQTAIIFHDAGYLTPPSQVFLDEGHARWSQQNYDANVKSLVEDSLGKDSAREVGNYIRTHAGTEIDWESDPIGSAIRVSDNTALFAEDKLPPLCRDVPGNLSSLERLATGQASLEETKAEMRDNIAKADLPKSRAARYNSAVDEVTAFTPKATLGMLGGKVDSVEWVDDHVKMNLKESPQNTRLNRIGDFGQRQFAKLAETYGADPKQFQKDLSFNYKSKDGRTLLEGAIVKSSTVTDRLALHLQSLASRLVLSPRNVASNPPSDDHSTPDLAGGYINPDVIEPKPYDRAARRRFIDNRLGISKEPHMHPQPVKELGEQSHGIVAQRPDSNAKEPPASQSAAGRYERLAALSKLADGEGKQKQKQKQDKRK